MDGSTSCHRATPGGPVVHARRVLAQAGEVDRGVQITVQDRAAVVTLVPSGRPGRAWLSPRRRPSRSSNWDTTGPRPRAGRRTRRSCSRAGGAPRPRAASAMARFRPRPPRPAPGLRGQAGHVQVLDDDHPVPLCQPRGGLVQHVAAQVRCSGVDPADSRRGPRPALRPATPRSAGRGHPAGPTLRCNARSRACALASGLGAGTRATSVPSGVAATSRSRTPRSKPTTGCTRSAATCAGRPGARSDLHGERAVPAPPIEGDSGGNGIRPAPGSTAVDSCVLTRPMRGSTTWCRSSTRIAPVVNRHDTRVRRRDLNRGKPDLRAATLAGPGIGPRLQAAGQRVQPGVVRLLRVLRPPRRQRRPCWRSTSGAAPAVSTAPRSTARAAHRRNVPLPAGPGTA